MVDFLGEHSKVSLHLLHSSCLLEVTRGSALDVQARRGRDINDAMGYGKVSTTTAHGGIPKVDSLYDV